MVRQLLMFAIYTTGKPGERMRRERKRRVTGWNKRENGGNGVDINPPVKGK